MTACKHDLYAAASCSPEIIKTFSPKGGMTAFNIRPPNHDTMRLTGEKFVLHGLPITSF